MPGKKRKAAEAELSRMEEGLASLSTEQLRKELEAAGADAGPIDASNR